MKTELQQMLIDRINALQDTDALLEMLSKLNMPVDENLLADVTVWATIKALDDLPSIDDDNQSTRFTSPNTRRYADDTKGVKLFFDGEWYINRKFNLKLRPEWLEITES